MVALCEEEPDHIRRYWFFDSLAQAEDYINWWNDLDSDPPGPLDLDHELEELLRKLNENCNSQ